MCLSPALVVSAQYSAGYDMFIGSSDRNPPALRLALLELRLRLHMLSKRCTQDLDASHIEALCASIQHIASEADAAGLTAYRSLAVRMLEQLDPMRIEGYLPDRMVQVVYECSGLLLACLVRPNNSSVAARLVRHFGDPRWEHPLCSAERSELLAALMAETAVGQI